MTADSGQTARADEIAEYVAQVRAALGDLPEQAQEELLEDLPAHLAEVAAEAGSPLRERLGPPEVYAAELRAAAAAESNRQPARRRRERLRARWESAAHRLHRLDAFGGPFLGYQRISEFGRLLVPAWWVLRGYLVAMIVVNVLDRHGQIGLLPRLGGSTLAGLVILLAFVAGSIWLGNRTPQLAGWPRRSVQLASALIVLIGLAGFAGIDANQRYRGIHGVPPAYVSGHPYDRVGDVYLFDTEGKLLTGVTMLDQDGRPIDIGWAWCPELEPDGLSEPASLGDVRRAEEADLLGRPRIGPDGEPIVTYPRCPEELPWWLTAREIHPTPELSPTPDLSATPDPSPSPTPTPEPTQPPTSSPSPTASPER